MEPCCYFYGLLITKLAVQKLHSRNESTLGVSMLSSAAWCRASDWSMSSLALCCRSREGRWWRCISTRALRSDKDTACRIYCGGCTQGIKLELFIFDTFPLAERVALLEVHRHEEFAPVKNAPGSKSDSPDTARQAMLKLHTRCGPVVSTKLHPASQLKGLCGLLPLPLPSTALWQHTN